MKRRIQNVMIGCALLGYILFTLSKLLRNQLTDFYMGFCEGCSFMLIIIWGIYMAYCLIKRRNPFTIGDKL